MGEKSEIIYQSVTWHLGKVQVRTLLVQPEYHILHKPHVRSVKGSSTMGQGQKYELGGGGGGLPHYRRPVKIYGIHKKTCL